VKKSDEAWAARKVERGDGRACNPETEFRLGFEAGAAATGTGTITIPTPHVTYGPEGIPANVADADYLRHAVKNIDYLSHGERLWGSGVTATVRKLLLDAAKALDPKATQ